VLDGRPGEHLGLKIMQERATRIGGELKIESDAGEGTRIILGFPQHGGETVPDRAIEVEPPAHTASSS
jgi:two-component system nitrate/nitrite sensor histidine kinase NarX